MHPVESFLVAFQLTCQFVLLLFSMTLLQYTPLFSSHGRTHAHRRHKDSRKLPNFYQNFLGLTAELVGFFFCLGQ